MYSILIGTNFTWAFPLAQDVPVLDKPGKSISEKLTELELQSRVDKRNHGKDPS